MNPSHHPSQILALDVGKKRTGIARASSMARIAEPLLSVDTAKIQECLRQLNSEFDVDCIVVGLPRSLEGNETEQTRWVREWVADIKPQLAVPFFWQDEALTTELAQKWMQDSKSGHDLDAHAAAAILDDFLKTPETDRQAC